MVASPHNTHWRYPSDRKNLTLFVYGRNATAPPPHLARDPETIQIWSKAAAYSAMSEDGQYVLFEGGWSFRYAAIMFASSTLA